MGLLGYFFQWQWSVLWLTAFMLFHIVSLHKPCSRMNIWILALVMWSNLALTLLQSLTHTKHLRSQGEFGPKSQWQDRSCPSCPGQARSACMARTPRPSQHLPLWQGQDSQPEIVTYSFVVWPASVNSQKWVPPAQLIGGAVKYNLFWRTHSWPCLLLPHAKVMN